MKLKGTFVKSKRKSGYTVKNTVTYVERKDEKMSEFTRGIANVIIHTIIRPLFLIWSMNYLAEAGGLDFHIMYSFGTFLAALILAGSFQTVPLAAIVDNNTK